MRWVTRGAEYKQWQQTQTEKYLGGSLEYLQTLSQ